MLYAGHSSLFEGIYMSVDTATVRRVARLARIKVTGDEAERMTNELNSILGFVEQLNEVDVAGVEPMTSVVSVKMRRRQDVVTDGEDAAAVTANAPVWHKDAAGTDDVTLDISASSANWQRYRYKAAQSIVPLRNMIWGQQQ